MIEGDEIALGVPGSGNNGGRDQEKRVIGFEEGGIAANARQIVGCGDDDHVLFVRFQPRSHLHGIENALLVGNDAFFDGRDEASQ